MKHLKSYKIFESTNSQLESDVRDMFLEIEDLGLDVDVAISPQDVGIWIIQVSSRRIFNWSDVSETFQRAKDYIQNSGRWTLEKSCVAYDDEVDMLGRIVSQRKDYHTDDYQKFIEFISTKERIYEVDLIFGIK